MILLEELDTEFGHIKIIRSKSDGHCTYYQNDCFHSQATAEGVSTCAYVHVMHSVIRQSEAKDILMIGCAGGTLATMLHRLGCKVTVVDVNPHAFTLARKYFHMPEEVQCIVDDGWSYLLRTGNRYDAIAIDAFSSDGTVPEQFVGEDFFLILKEVLRPSGVVVMNVMVAHDLDLLADRIALNMSAANLPATLFDWPGRTHRNTIIGGGVVEQIQVVSQKKPRYVRRELQGVIRRLPQKRAITIRP